MTFMKLDWITGSVVVILVLVALAGCTPTVDPEEPTETPEPIITETPQITPIPTQENADLQRMLAQAKQDLADRLQLPVDELMLIEIKAVTWTDSSLGCPEPGENYLPALHDGFLLRIEAEGEIYQYHSGVDYVPFLCESPIPPHDERSIEAETGATKPGEEVSLEKPEPIQTPADRESQDLVGQAKADLAARLGISLDEIELVLFEAVTWRDGSLGCPEPGVGYIQVLIDGHRIQLLAGGQVFHYHSGKNEPPFLCKNPVEPLTTSGDG